MASAGRPPPASRPPGRRLAGPSAANSPTFGPRGVPRRAQLSQTCDLTKPDTPRAVPRRPAAMTAVPSHRPAHRPAHPSRRLAVLPTTGRPAPASLPPGRRPAEHPAANSTAFCPRDVPRRIQLGQTARLTKPGTPRAVPRRPATTTAPSHRPAHRPTHQSHRPAVLPSAGGPAPVSRPPGRRPPGHPAAKSPLSVRAASQDVPSWAKRPV
jgi:hypothetical protein